MKEILPFVTTWMNLEDMMLSEISQTQKGKYHVISLIRGICNSQPHGSRTQIGGCQRLGEGRMERNFLMSKRFYFGVMEVF